MKNENDNVYTYIIDNENKIVFVDNKNWDTFYKMNTKSNSCLSNKILEKSIYDYISGFETKHLYENIFFNVRKYNRRIIIPIRCDSPKQRRFLNITIRPLKDNYIEISSEVKKTEKREYISLLDYSKKHNDELLTVCSMCKKIKIKNNLWEEVENAVIILKLFEKKELPSLTHGLCPYCEKLYMNEVNEFLANIEKN